MDSGGWDVLKLAASYKAMVKPVLIERRFHILKSDSGCPPLNSWQKVL